MIQKAFQKHWMRGAVFAALLVGAGCVSEKIEPAYIPRVATSRNHEGMVFISWPSRVGYNYRLVARDDQGRAVVGKQVYVGTGETIRVEFKRDPRASLPDYSVVPEKTGGRK